MVKKPLTEVILHEGNINTILGTPGAGKTNFAAFLMQMGVKYYFKFATNIHFFDPETVPKAIELGRLPTLPEGMKYKPIPPGIKTCTVISDMFLHILDGGRNCVMLDEAGIFASSTSPMDKRVKSIKELAFIIRHLNASFCLIGQAKKSIAPDLRNTLVTYEMRLRRISQTYRSVHIYKSNTEEDHQEDDITFHLIDKIGRIPLTTIPWDGYFIPKFDFDIDLHDAFNELGNYDSVEVLDHAKDIIMELKDKAQSKEDSGPRETVYEMRQRAKYFVEELVANEPNIRKPQIMVRLADEFNKSVSWARQVVGGMDL